MVLQISTRGLGLASGLLLVLLTSCVGRSSAQYTSIMDFVNNRTELSVLKAAVEKVNLTATLSATNLNATAFLPTDAAFTTFALSLGLANASALLGLDTAVLTKLLLLHIGSDKYPVTTVGQLANLGLAPTSSLFPFSTLLSPAGSSPSNMGLKYKWPSNVSDLTATKVVSVGSTAGLVTFEVSAGTAVAYTIDTVLVYWYNTIADALTDMVEAAELVTALKANGLWNTFTNPNAQLTVFAPTSTAVSDAKNRYNVDLAANSSTSIDVLTYHVTYGTFPIDYNAPGTGLATYTSINGNKTLIANQTGEGAVQVNGFGSSWTVNNAMIQVGGPTPKSLIHSLNGVLMPTYTTIWQYLSTNSDYSLLASLFVREGNEINKLRNPGSTITLLAPTNKALQNLARQQGVANVELLLLPSNYMGAFLRNHLLPTAMAKSSFVDGSSVTIVGATSNLTVSVSSGVVKLNAGQTSGQLVAPFDTAVSYGKAQVQSLDFPLIPKWLVLPVAPGGGGAASSSMPSLLLLAVGLLASRAAVRMAN